MDDAVAMAIVAVRGEIAEDSRAVRPEVDPVFPLPSWM